VTLPVALAVVAQQLLAAAQSDSEFSRSTTHHALASMHTGQDSAIVALAVVAIVVTTAYTVWFLVRPGEAGEDHIKRRIIDDGHEGFR
jgi:hypothetical protein